MMTRQIQPAKGHRGANIQADGETNDISPDKMPPIFSLEIKSDYCITSCTKEEKGHFALTLHKLSQLPWTELRNSNKHALGYEKIRKGSIRATMPKDITDDVDIIAFRFSGMKPMVGYRDAIDRRIFHILWIDRKFKLYNHGG